MSVQKSTSRTGIVDTVSGVTADVETLSGKNRLLTDSIVTIDEILGKDPFADSWFRIENTGATSDTIKIDIAATVNDPSTPDRDLAVFSKTFTTVAGEVGDELKLRDRIISELNADGGFVSAELEANKVKDNAVIVISSMKRGEFFERPTAGDFDVTVTGTASVTIGFNNFIIRGKVTELTKSSGDPRQGILGFAGTIIQQAITGYMPQYLEDSGGSNDMKVDGSVTPVVFKVDSDPNDDLIITDFFVLGQDGNIILTRFFDTGITNGFLIEIISDGLTTTFPDIITTADLVSVFASIGGIETIQENKVMRFSFSPQQPFVLKAGTSDKVRITVRDDVTGLVHLSAAVFGFLDI